MLTSGDAKTALASLNVSRNNRIIKIKEEE